MKKQVSLLTIITAFGVLYSTSANSAAFNLREQSTKGQGFSFAGVAAGDKEDPSYVYFNPASSSLIEGTHSSVNTSVIFALTKADYVIGTTKSPLNVNIPGDATENNLLGTFIVPSAYISSKLNDNLAAALTINSPFALATEYSPNWVGRYHGVKSEITTYNISPTLSYKLNDNIAVGGGPVAQYFEAQLTNAMDFSSGAAPGTLDGYADMQGAGWDLGWTAGVILTPRNDFRVGFSYRSKTEYDINGEVDFEVPAPAFAAAGYVNQGATTKITLPSIYNFGARWDINEKWAVMGEVDWVRWSCWNKLDIDFDRLANNSVTMYNWRDTWFTSLGAEYKWNDKLTLKGGLALDQSPIKHAETRTPRVPDASRQWISAGADYKYSDNLTFNASFSYIMIDTSYSDLYAADAGNSGRGDLKAKYSGHIDVLSLGLKYTF